MGFTGEGRWIMAGIAGVEGGIAGLGEESPVNRRWREEFRERYGDNEERRRRVIISEDSDGHGFVGIPSV